MIVGAVLNFPTPPPRWFARQGLRCATGERLATVHLGVNGRGSRFQSGHVTVVMESSPTRGPDGQAVAEAYGRFGIRCAQHLPGRFRFLLHDAEARRVVAASSTAPPWPLAYWSDSRTTVVGSRLVSMLRCPDVRRTLDETYLLQLVLGLSAMRQGSTILRDVRRLCPGEVLVADADGVRVTRVDRLTPRDVGGEREQLGRLFAEELTDAIAAFTERGRSAISLSGGLDSAAVAGLALRRASEMPALTFVAPALDASAEIASIDAMERAWPGLRLTRVDASDAFDLPDLGPDLRDDPLLTPLALLLARMRLWSRAQGAGLDTLIEGEGGDELFSMLPTPLDAFRSGHLVDAARHVLASPWRRSLAQHGLLLPLLPSPVRNAWLTKRRPIEAHLPSFITWDARDRPAVREAVMEYLATLVHRPFETRLDEWLSAPTFVGASLSRRHLAAGFGLDLEWPMLERGVLELVLGLHAARALRGGPNEPFLQDALAGTVPDDVRLAPKDVGLYREFIPRVLTSRRSREALRDERVKRRLDGLVRFERIEAMLEGLAAGRSLTTAALWQLECVISFAQWYASASREHGVD